MIKVVEENPNFLSDVKINTSELVIFTVINFQLLTLV